MVIFLQFSTKGHHANPHELFVHPCCGDWASLCLVNHMTKKADNRQCPLIFAWQMHIFFNLIKVDSQDPVTNLL
jgi:hypothetical protein